ncbi:transcriptional regulator [Bacillus timonensis]|nr:transcriptional regulator [Bacillus timonensis]
MSRKVEVLQTKITPPNVKEHTLRRPSLIKKMKAITNFPLTIIHSGPGYGKTTALASFVADKRSSYSFSWYSISTNDDDLFPFLTYLIFTIRKQFPGFGTELLAYIEKIERYIRDEDIRSLCSMFINEVAILSQEVTLIIDDYHIVAHSTPVDQWMNWLIQHIPSNLHIVIASRTCPTWPMLTSMKVKNEYLEIDQHDMMFSFEEIDVLLRDLYEYDLEERDVKQIYTLTEGWIIAISMMLQQLTIEGKLNGSMMKEAYSLDDLFRFLAMEVFVKQPPMVQQFLEHTCIFEELTGSICDHVLGISSSDSMLMNLSNKNVFLFSIGEGQYRYHALFKEFLEKQLKTTNELQYKTLHKQTANYYVKHGKYDEAIRHLEAIQDFESMASILNHYGKKMIEQGSLQSLLERLSKLPESLKDHYYLLWFYKGEVLRYRCSYEEAEVCYKKAVEKAEVALDYIGWSEALEGQARIYLDTIQPGKAERFLQKAIEMIDRTNDASPINKSRLYRLMAENFTNAGQGIKAKKWYEKSKDLEIPLQDGNLESRLYLRTGKLVEGRKILQQKKIREEKEHGVHLQQSHRETDLLFSLIEAFMGNGKVAKELAQSGIQQGVKFQAPFVEACGWIRMGHAVQLLDKYDSSLAKQCYETALEMMESINVSRGKAEPLMGLSILYGNLGIYERSIEYGKQALAETEKVKDSWLSALILLCMGIASVHNEKWEAALDYLNRGGSLLQDCGDQYGHTMTELWKAFLAFYTNKETDFTTHMSMFLQQLQMGNYEFVLTKRTTFGPRDLNSLAPLLLEAQNVGIHRQYVGILLNELGISNMTRHPGYTLRIQTLGQFRVFLGNQEVLETDWQRGKAKELLELFVTLRNGYIPKEEIFSILWPTYDEKQATRDFKVALNALNNALEPNRKARVTPFFIQRLGSAYGLNPNAGASIDSEDFEEWIQAGLNEKDTDKTIECLLRGLESYEGDYLPDRKYDDWCLNERERLQVFFLRGSERLAQAFVQKEWYDKAIYWCERIIDKDQTWEEAYRLLMFCYYQKNNRPQAIKWYKKCLNSLEKELGVEPMQPTQQMYQMIITADSLLKN